MLAKTLAAASLSCLFGVATAIAADDRPNVLLIVADDQSPFDFQMYNPRSTLETPTLDRLAARGVVLDEAYHMGSWSGAVCTPSRHMIMSGRTVWHIPDRRSPGRSFYTGDPTRVPPNLADYTLPAVFNRAGYQTFRTCKQGNSYPAANAKFQIRRDESKRGGTDETGSAWHAERVLEFLDSRAEQGAEKPFLVYLGFSHPHDPRYGKPELLAKYGATNHADRDAPPTPEQTAHSPPIPVNYLPEHPFPHGHPKLRDEVAVEGVWKRRDTATIQNEIGREFACSENIDTQLGRVFAKLEQLGELDNTIILYTADHGIAIGRHGLTGKQNLYEHTWRVPMIAAGPGIAAGERAPGGVYLLDILQTVCELTGVDAPDTVEGESFAPLLRCDAPRVRNVMFGVYSGGTKPGMRSVRSGDWKLIKYDVLDGSVRETQLFNLAENPWEFLDQHQDPGAVAATGQKPRTNQRDLAEDPAYRDRLLAMERLLLDEQKRLEDPHRLWDQPPRDE
ncbi:MAG: sulfatase-like hydrolase/transferase [Planctomycetota bacterium]